MMLSQLLSMQKYMFKNLFRNKQINVVNLVPYGFILIGIAVLIIALVIGGQAVVELLNINEQGAVTLLIDETKIRQAIELINTQTVPN